MCFGYSKEPSHWDGSFEYPQHIFWMRNKENSFPICTLIWRPMVCTVSPESLLLQCTRYIQISPKSLNHYSMENLVSWPRTPHRSSCVGSSSCSGGSCAARRIRSERIFYRTFYTRMVFLRCAAVYVRWDGVCAWRTLGTYHMQMDGHLWIKGENTLNIY